MARVSALFSYPVKGCAGVPLAAARLAPTGLPHDRAFLVTDPEGVFRSQRADPRLALARPALGAHGDRLTLTAPGLEPVTVPVDTTGPARRVTLFGDPYTGIDQGQAVADWFTELLGRPSRLVRVPPDHRRTTTGLTPGTSNYADSAAVSLLSQAALTGLNERLAARGEPPLPMDRFRPNVVLDEVDAPHEEDAYRALTLGEARLGFAKLAVRCAVTLVDQRTGARAGPEPLRTLADYRRAPAGGVAFGAKFAVLGPGALAVGDRVAALTRADAAEPAPTASGSVTR
ncbi:MOSC N-terminal beta barrel domain-containing protein [Streptomyces sp. DSM 44915]|uniref:MOSC N-terminal beta barrel domain-containing protein n=1 Tax=Streptomyces chisholmiae TaxID=3075540 RepID=A0ABU2JJE0_9ACTN|nr:MOSC N-terminal beta barrel domain-containing protein [Streptomyces sp. DSM 44915]MDT0264804.1 MOSC N-terminal beta barrel domain-containing protein [Streptomyces sp. DSM 44915]